MGDVIEKNILLVKSTTEKISATLHANRKDIWVVMHEWNNNTFNSFLVTENGVALRKVSSSVGSVHSNTNGSDQIGYNAIGQMKISPDGELLALILKESKIAEVFSFDSSDGELKFLYMIDQTSSNDKLYGLEFSPNSKFLYVSDAGKFIYQVNLDSKEKILLKNDYNFDESGQLQLGPDGKIYVAKLNKYYLGLGEKVILIIMPHAACGWGD